jgi:hypothetical protein
MAKGAEALAQACLNGGAYRIHGQPYQAEPARLKAEEF